MKVLVIDSFGLIHRAYHALPNFQTKTGEPSGAVFGFCSMFLKIISEFKPEGVVACFDLRGRTFRNDLFADYQAQREEKGEDFHSQVAKVKDFLKIVGVKELSFSGHDGDDAVGSAVKFLLLKPENEIMILTGDNDLLQLVEPRVKVVYLKKGISETIIYDEKAVEEKYGFGPLLIPDFKALAGDSSDNIPGVLGIGPKTATNLISEFGDLESIFQAARLGKVKEKISQKILAEENQAKMFKDLATIRRDLVKEDFEFVFEPAKLSNQTTIDFLSRLGFHSLIKRLGQSEATKEELKTSIPELKEASFKEVTSSIKKNKTLFFWNDLISDGRVFARAIKPSEKEEFFYFVWDSNLRKISFAFKDFFHQFGQKLLKFPQGEIIDLQVLAWLEDSSLLNPDLSKVSKRFLGIDLRTDQELSFLIALWERFSESTFKNLYFEVEAPLLKALFLMEKNGLLLDLKKWQSFEEKVSLRINEISKRIFELSGRKLNLNSPREVSELLFLQLKLSTKKSRKLKSGFYSTDSEVLEKLAVDSEIAAMILEWRESTKLLNTYIKTLPNFINSSDSRIHTTFLQTGTATGRLSSESPNLQNIPKHVAFAEELRQAFVSESGFSFVSFDYSQIELRLAACLSKDKNLTEAFLSGQDIHRQTASIIWEMPLEKVSSEKRFQAKALNFGILYGMGPRAFSETAKVSLTEAKIFMDDYFQKFPGLKDYLDQVLIFLRENGWVETFFHRRRYLPEIFSGRPQLVAQAERMALNFTIQGLAADIIKKAMVSINQKVLPKFDNQAKMILQIHDELLFEIKNEIIEEISPLIKKEMESAFQGLVPLLVEQRSGQDWSQV